MDAYQVRFPTNVMDVGRVLVDLTRTSQLFPILLTKIPSSLNKATSLMCTDLEKPLPPILHYASPAPSMTKYDMTSIIASALKLSIAHVIPDRNRPESKPGQTERPENTQLSIKALSDLGVHVREEQGFEEWWKAWVSKSS